MSLFLTKLLSLFVYPLGLTCILLFLALVFGWLRYRRLASVFTFTAFTVLWLSSTPVVGRYIYAQLESRYPPIAVENLKRAEVAVLLGGSVQSKQSPRLAPEVEDAFDRVLHAVALFKAGKIDRILITGGNVPWLGDGEPEAKLTADILISLNVPRDAVILETQSRNTYENAHFSRPLWESEKFASGYLVTSAAHMPRAMAVFEKAGYSLNAAATDYQVSYPIARSALDWLPSHEGLYLTTLAMRETLGLLVYRWRGWA